MPTKTPSLPTFDTEVLLQQAVAALLARLPNVRDVQVLQGAAEIGKDIVFAWIGPLGETLHCAAVVKNTRLTGRVGSRGSVRAAFDQIEQCLDSPYLDARGEARRIHHVYVISPHEMPQTTIASIAGKLQSRAGQVVFLTGAELLRLFQRYWPDFLLQEASVLERYTAAINAAAGDSAALSSLAFDFDLGQVPETASPVYVEPSFERVLYSFDLQDLAAYFPAGRSWTRAAIERARAACQALSRTLDHVRGWPFPVGGVVRSLQTGEAIAAIEMFARDLESVFVAAYGQQSQVRALKVEHVPRDIVVKFSKELSKRLEAASQTASGIVGHNIQSLVESLTSSADAVKKLQPAGAALLKEPDFRRACLIDDCLQASPTQCIRVTGSRTLVLGTGILAHCADDLLVVGGPGTGKTSYCRRRALADAEQFASGKSDIAPVYVALHKLARADVSTFDRAFLTAISQSALLPRVDLSSGAQRIRCYLDGLDEVPSPTQRAVLLQLALHGPGRPPHSQVVVTARDYLFDRHFETLPRVQLSGLDETGLMALANGWLDGDCRVASSFIEQVRKSAIEGLLRVPLLATVTILVFKRTQRIPESRSRLYSTFVNLLCGGWDLAKGVIRPTRFGVSAKQVVLAGLANELHRLGVREFNSGVFRRVAKRSLGGVIAGDSDGLLEEVLRDGIVTRSGPLLHFCHQSIQEFMTAKYRLGDPNRSGLTTALRKYLRGDDWWREVLCFYIGLSDNPDGVERWLDSNVNVDDDAEGRARCDFLYDALAEAFPHYVRRRSRGARTRVGNVDMNDVAQQQGNAADGA